SFRVSALNSGEWIIRFFLLVMIHLISDCTHLTQCPKLLVRINKLDMILSDCPVNSSQSPGLFSKKLGESPMSFFCSGHLGDASFPAILEQRKLLIPGSRTAMGRNVLQWLDRQGLQPNILGEFDDVALMKAFARYHHDAIFLAPSLYMNEVGDDLPLQLIGQIDDLKEEYYVIFAERMIQHPAVKNVCDADFSKLFA
ncbi:transcriptional activator NhaR, partial [Vibrio aestuarianus subsp. cardii]|nr:transcriptional activator NhaR [Vibrio aestuarianus subsp. cardii]